METKKLRKTETKRKRKNLKRKLINLDNGYVRFRFRCISISRHVTWYGSTNS